MDRHPTPDTAGGLICGAGSALDCSSLAVWPLAVVRGTASQLRLPGNAICIFNLNHSTLSFVVNKLAFAYVPFEEAFLMAVQLYPRRVH